MKLQLYSRELYMAKLALYFSSVPFPHSFFKLHKWFLKENILLQLWSIAKVVWKHLFNHFCNKQDLQNHREINRQEIFLAPLNITNDTKLREFQYKYLMHKIPNNQFLFKCKLKNYNICDFCNMCIDSNRHMFWECQLVQNLWSEVKTIFINNITWQPMNIELSYEKNKLLQ